MKTISHKTEQDHEMIKAGAIVLIAVVAIFLLWLMFGHQVGEAVVPNFLK